MIFPAKQCVLLAWRRYVQLYDSDFLDLLNPEGKGPEVAAAPSGPSTQRPQPKATPFPEQPTPF